MAPGQIDMMNRDLPQYLYLLDFSALECLQQTALPIEGPPLFHLNSLNLHYFRYYSERDLMLKAQSCLEALSFPVQMAH